MISSDRLNIKQIRAHWDEILSAAGYLNQTVHGDSLADDQKTRQLSTSIGLAVALRELGRIERTLFILTGYEACRPNSTGMRFATR
jgi:TnpA family transposase